MASFDEKAGNTIRANQRRMKKAAKAAEAKKQGQPKSNLGRQFDTPLSRMYDNDGNPVNSEPRGYTPYGGH
jgi:hypothetical protein